MKNKAKTAGIICEFNPLHSGHAYLMKKIRESGCDNIVALMSGNYVQRGEPAIFDKYTRAEAALVSGADLVFELPVPHSCSGAEKFAEAGVRILDSLGMIDELWFGSECGNITKLANISEFLLSENFNEKIQRSVNGNTNFASERAKIISESLGDEYGEILNNANNILACEYIKSLKKINSDIIPKTIRRFGAAHDDDEVKETVSASYLRSLLFQGESISDISDSKVNELYSSKKASIASALYAERAILYTLRNGGTEDILKCMDVSEGLENRIYKAACSAQTLNELYAMIKSKRYSHARIRRIILHSFLGITGESFDLSPYTRILGYNDHGLQLLNEFSNRIPIVSGTSRNYRASVKLCKAIALSEHCDELYGLFMKNIGPADIAYRNKVIKK